MLGVRLIRLEDNMVKHMRRSKKNIDKNITLGLKNTLDTIVEQSLKITPMKTGTLRDSVEIDVYSSWDRSFGHEASITFTGLDPETQENYAYIRHEIPAGKYTTEGTKHNYLRDITDEYLDANNPKKDLLTKNVLKL